MTKALREGLFTTIFGRDCQFLEVYCNLRNSDRERYWKGRRSKITETRHEQETERTLNQDFVAPAAYLMPIEVVSVRMREHQHLARTPSGVVFWTAAGMVRRNKRMKEFEGGRRPTTGRSGTKDEMNRRISLESEQMLETEGSIISVGKKEWFSCLTPQIWEGDCYFTEEFFNIEQRIKNNLHTEQQRNRDSKDSWRQIKRIQRAQGSCTTSDQ